MLLISSNLLSLQHASSVFPNVVLESQHLLFIRNNPEVHAVLFNLQTQDVKKSQVDLVHVEREVLVMPMLASLEDFHIETVRIVRTIVVPSFDGSVITSVLVNGETRQ